MPEDLKIKVRVRWSDFNHYEPIRIIITDWKNLKIINYGLGKYMSVDCIMEHGKHPIELLIPYGNFVAHLRNLRSVDQKMIIDNVAIVEIEKTYKHDNWGMRIRKVEPYINEVI